MSDIGDILARKHLPQEPSEFRVIRSFVEKNFGVTPRLQLRDKAIIISVPGSAVAGSLRFHLPELQSQLDSEYSLVIVSN